MTCREKLKINHPSAISENAPGGCVGCPYDYGYAGKPYYCTPPVTCEKCWDREVEEVKEEKEKKKMTVEELVQLLDKGTRFEIAEVYNGAVMFMSSFWYQNKRNGMELWENVRQREVELITAQDTGEVKIFVSLAPPVEKDS